MRPRPSCIPRLSRSGPRLCTARWGLATLLGIVGLSGCASRPVDRAADLVLLVTIDTLPADRVGCYGDPSVRTPLLDRLARRGIQVIDAISPAPLTLPSHTTLLTGLDPPQHGVRENGLFVAPDSLVTIPERLPPGTPRAAFIGAFPLARRFGLAQGFDIYDADLSTPIDRRRAPERRADDVLRAASAWLERADSSKRPFVWVHLFDPHFPYVAPDPWPRVAASLRGAGPYEGEVAWVDAALRRFLDETAERDWDPLVLVVADHGESLGRHGEISHGLFVYDATQRVPLLWSGPGVRAWLEPTPRPLRDVTATLLAAGGSAPEATGPGIPLDSTSAADETYLETKHTELMRGWAPLFSLRTPDWKFVRAPRPELYDLRADPGETDNVLADHPDRAARMSARLDELLATQVAAGPIAMSDETAEQLRSLGYVATPGEPARADRRKDPKDGAAGAAALFWGEEAWVNGDLAAAEKHLLEAIRLDPAAKEAYSFLAGVYARLGRFPLAVRYAEESLSLPPHLNEAPVHATLGEALFELGRIEEALPHLKAASEVRRADPRLERLLAAAEAQAR